MKKIYSAEQNLCRKLQSSINEFDNIPSSGSRIRCYKKQIKEGTILKGVSQDFERAQKYVGNIF
jgi:hypothetical protein